MCVRGTVIVKAEQKTCCGRLVDPASRRGEPALAAGVSRVCRRRVCCGAPWRAAVRVGATRAIRQAASDSDGSSGHHSEDVDMSQSHL